MFSQLKSLVEIIRDATVNFKSFKSQVVRESTVVTLLETYFILKDIVEDGEALVAEAGPNPAATIELLSPGVAALTIKRWDDVLRKQGFRLYNLRERISRKDALSVLYPDLQDRLKKVIGNKMDRVVTLHGIGSALYLRGIFQPCESNSEKASYVALMAGSDGDTLDPVAVRREISDLRVSLDQYRLMVERLVTTDEVVRLSAIARQGTLLGAV